MYYEFHTKQSSPHKKRPNSLWRVVVRLFLKLIALLLVLTIAFGTLLYFIPTSMVAVQPSSGNLSPSQDLPSEPFNVLLLGVDALNSGVQRSDTMIIASISRGSVKLTSLLRDTEVYIEGYGTRKLNAAYAYGGPELTMRTINQNFDMNLMKYVVIDYITLVKMVDAIGGVEVDITEKEVDQINFNVYSLHPTFIPLGYSTDWLTAYGTDVHLNGLQALGYSQIRKIDSDFVRTSRQRAVINAMLEKIHANIYNPILLSRLISSVLNGIKTNLTPLELVSLAEKALLTQSIRQLRLPVSGSYSDNGSSIRLTDPQACIDSLHTFIYEK